MAKRSPSDHLRALRRRAEFLEQRVVNADVELAFDRQERAALIWAIDHMTDCRVPRPAPDTEAR